MVSKDLKVISGEHAWRTDRPRTYDEWLEDSWEGFLDDTDERAVTEPVHDERGLPKDD